MSRAADERPADIAEAINRIRGYVGDLESASIDSPVRKNLVDLDRAVARMSSSG